MFRSTISKEEIATMPPARFEGEIVVVDTRQQIDAAYEYLSAQSVIGFDTESRASFQKGVVNKIALLQLSAGNKCFLFRLNKIKLDKAILKILESKSITKVGLSVDGDIRELGTLRQFRPKGFVDLQKTAPRYGIQDMSLMKIAAIVLGLRISKAQRLSNWEAATLTEAQQQYAATDAWVCVEIYKKILSSHQL
jgi:ribonuclease D